MHQTSEEEFIEHVFAKKGFLATLLKEYEERKEQLEMAKQIASAYRNSSIALIEAGTGTGKSFAYLIPAFIWALKHKEKTVISTHTIALQEQLLQKDIPFLLKAIKRDVKVCLVKGMKNYVCVRKFKQLQEQPLLIAPGESQTFHKLKLWTEETQEGSKSDITFSVAPSLWDKISADADSCNHMRCPHYKKCFFFKARNKADDAQILIVNHALLFADIQLALQEKERILPAYQRLILDEAHHIEQVALDSFTQRIDRLHLYLSLTQLHSPTHLEKCKVGLLKTDVSLPESAAYYCDIEIPKHVQNSLELLQQVFEAIAVFLDAHAQKTSDSFKLRLKAPMYQTRIWKETLIPSCESLAKELQKLARSLSLLYDKLDELPSTPKIINHSVELRATLMRLEQVSTFLLQFITPADMTHIRWIEVSPSNTILFDACLEVATFCKEHLFAPLKSAVLCSATLTTARAFTYTKQRLGIQQSAISEGLYDSPFDFSSRCLFLIPTDLPFPHESSYFSEQVFTIEQAIYKSQGNAFVLFTSYEMLLQCYRTLSASPLFRSYPLLKQGDFPRHMLLEEFKKRPGSVLFATDSFWEGVDVPGDALQCVIITKLPFPVPSDPLYEGRAEILEKQGLQAFTDYAIPQAVIKFKQGFGRLLRTKKDRGCVLCLDTRLVKKAYGKFFLNSLPASATCFAPRDQILDKMNQFFATN